MEEICDVYVDQGLLYVNKVACMHVCMYVCMYVCMKFLCAKCCLMCSCVYTAHFAAVKLNIHVAHSLYA